jgi:flavin reductase (DIM6/NTAB) family NADH-FMN oxidoreductase RutF
VEALGARDGSKSALSVTYSAVVSTISTDRSPLLSRVVPVLLHGLQLTLELPRQSTTAKNLSRTGECVINLPGVETIAAIERLAQAVASTDNSCDFKSSPIVLGGRLTLAHMTLVPSEAVSPLRALECPMQLEAKIEGNICEPKHERVVPLDRSLTLGLNVCAYISTRPLSSATFGQICGRRL